MHLQSLQCIHAQDQSSLRDNIVLSEDFDRGRLTIVYCRLWHWTSVLQGLLKDQLEVVQVQQDGQLRYAIKPIAEKLSFDKVAT